MDNILIGKVVTDLKIADDKKALLFVTTGEDIIVKVDGDCCSDSWIEHIESPALGFPAKVIGVEDLEMPDAEYDEDEWCLAFYGCKISTDKGDLVIDYRNESNGYYGGNLSWPDEDYFYGGVYGQNISTENWVDVADTKPQEDKQ